MKKLIVANWKMNPESPREAKEIFNSVKRTALTLNKVNTIICPPAVYLSLFQSKSSKLTFGAQDCFGDLFGAYTGKIGPTMLRNSGATYLILGHSETRAMGDNDLAINHKLRLALKNNLKVILCVGEHHRDEQANYLQFIKTQLEENLRNVQRKSVSDLVIAYEPIWAIGAQAKGADNPEGFQHQAIYIRKILAAQFGKEAAMKIPVLYGGSANSQNAEGFLRQGEADGLLVGRASLDPSEFNKMLKIAEQC
jgi:triosephosphate isomerase